MSGYREAINAAMPRLSAVDPSVPFWSPRKGIASLADMASLPGRAYASLGRPQGETYLQALGRTGPTLANANSPLYQGEGDELAETILRKYLAPEAQSDTYYTKGGR